MDITYEETNDIQELSMNEIEKVNGALIPLIYGAYYAGSAFVSYFGGAQVLGFVIGSGISGMAAWYGVYE